MPGYWPAEAMLWPEPRQRIAIQAASRLQSGAVTIGRRLRFIVIGELEACHLGGFIISCYVYPVAQGRHGLRHDLELDDAVERRRHSHRHRQCEIP